jgi:hypothetical protein
MRHEKERGDSSFARNGRCSGRLNQHSRSYRLDATIDCSGRQNFFAKIDYLRKKRVMDLPVAVSILQHIDHWIGAALCFTFVCEF